MTLQFYVYGSDEIDYLSKRDPLLGQAISRIGPIRRPVNSDIFQSLVRSIVGQQISTKAQATIWQRMLDKFTPFTPRTIGALTPKQLQSCGITMRKAVYIKEITRAVLCGELDFSQLETMSDQEACARLCQLKGVGVWTAEMLLIFSMQRPDVLSYGDLAIQRGLRMLYGQESISRPLFEEYRQRYSPHGTVASLYLWAIAGGALPELIDPAGNKSKRTKGKEAQPRQ